ncbi:cation/calcium exchanger 5-like [Quercus robur]|uniref:cation/calcium exchanger 5-like n=1 Tax=Quercus robur TaxID=38942 RepID=UPI002161E6FB|nr:cation/calcium exchanger 5-like [Quercus robur]
MVRVSCGVRPFLFDELEDPPKDIKTTFSIVTTKLTTNGAPDVFASVAAVRGGQYRTGFGAILSAGTFVSAFVVGFLAIYAAPFSLNPVTFAVGFYVFFVGIVFWMDFGLGEGRRKVGAEVGLVGEGEVEKGLVEQDCEIGEFSRNLEEVKLRQALRKEYSCKEFFRKVYADVLDIPNLIGWVAISKAWQLPVMFLLKLTIRQTTPSEWSRFYASANIVLCPLALLYACNSFMPFDHPTVFLLPQTHFPLWFIILFASFSLAVLHFIIEKEPPKTEQIPVLLIAFVMSVFWISTIAGELLNCLEALGSLLELPPALLGLTVLAWGNLVGDLVADVAVAKTGQPAMAMAGFFAGPMFNMLVGLGTALVIQTADVYPNAFELHFHLGIVSAFVFLLLSLMGSLLVIIWYRFWVPRFWGFCLVGLYILFMAVSLIIAKFSG